MKMRLALLISITLLACNSKTSHNFKEIENPATGNSSIPFLYSDKNNVLSMSWTEENSDTAFLYYSSLINNEWSSPKLISKSDNWFVNWADYPAIITDGNQLKAAHWLNKVEGNTYSYHVKMKTDLDSGSRSFSPHFDDSSATEHGFLSMTPFTDSSFVAVWLDGRNTEGRSHHEYSDISKAMTLRSAEISYSGSILQNFEIDSAVCDCCNTSVVNTKNGLLVAYRDRTKEEIRDIYLSRFENGEWSDPKAISNENWEFAACPVNGPKLYSYDNLVVLAWFTGVNNNGTTKFKISSDSGSNFGNEIVLDDDQSIGRVNLTINSKNEIYFTWLAKAETTAILKVAKYNDNGDFLYEKDIAQLENSRAVGFPQIGNSGKQVIVAWTHLHSDKSKSIKTVLLD